jgi:predicted aconitase with swiveling domain
MSTRVLTGHVGVGPRVEGRALVAKDNFSARYDLDRIKGIFSRPAHKLAGQSYVDRILVLDNAKGGVATAWMLAEMASRGMAPKALLFNRVNPIMAQGAAFAGVALIDRFDVDLTEEIRTGDRLVVDPESGTVEVHRDGQGNVDNNKTIKGGTR